MVNKATNTKSEAMTKYKHSNWCCKPKTEAEAKEIIERAVANGAVLYESVGPDRSLRQYPWDLCSAWGVFEELTYTSDLGRDHYLLAGSEELTIEQVRERFPLPSKVDWTKAPRDAQFYSCRGFRKHASGDEYVWHETNWEVTGWNSLEWHEKIPDFELRTNTEQAGRHYTHEYQLHTSTPTVKCVIIAAVKDDNGNIVVLNEHGFYRAVLKSEIRPIRTDRDEWIEDALSTAPVGDSGLLRSFAESIYDAMKEGMLEKPQ